MSDNDQTTSTIKGESNSTDPFLNELREIIHSNLSDSQFGVSELADKIGMSRSNLLRRVKKASALSVSVFIRNVRLQNAHEILEEENLTISEVAYQVGFSSPSYFIKCFHEYYGAPPGEVRKGTETNNSYEAAPKGSWNLNRKMIAGTALGFILLVLVLLIWRPFTSKSPELERSIAVLPFKNNSSDSSNVYIINGLMESVLNNLQKIEDLKVISRTSVEKYRMSPLIGPEIAEELGVNYFVEGSGQKIGNQIRLNIQLIEAKTDRQLWTAEYLKTSDDIFTLQSEVASDIANQIKAVVTPEEEEQINKIPTENALAYDYFLKGLDLMFQGGENIGKAITYYQNAISEDPDFARAYAGVAISYFFMEAVSAERYYLDSINYYADKALLLDPKLPQGLVAKALYFLNSEEYEKAVPFLERAYEYHPNSPLIINTLSDFYATYMPDTEKYLQYALKGIQLNVIGEDSTMTSYIYLHVANAMVQTGFVQEAKQYIERSFSFDPHNLYTARLDAYVDYADSRDLTKTKDALIDALAKDSTRIDIVMEIGKMYYYLRDFKMANAYFKELLRIREEGNLDLYMGENAKIGLALDQLGIDEEVEELFSDYKEYADRDNSIYRYLSLSVYYSFMNDTDNAIKNLGLFSEQDNYYFWIVLFLRIDPLYDNLKGLPEFNQILDEIDQKFWKNHERIRASLTKQGLI